MSCAAVCIMTLACDKCFHCTFAKYAFLLHEMPSFLRVKTLLVDMEGFFFFNCDMFPFGEFCFHHYNFVRFHV